MTWEQCAAVDRIIPVGEATRLQWVLNHQLLGERFVVQVAYTDVRGGQEMRTRQAVKLEAGEWHVSRVAVYEGNDETGRLPVRSGEWRDDE
jgi:hypothetical protein